LKESIITIEVRNNATITQEELERIQRRLLKAREYNDMEDALINLLDDSEGAGLGLVMLVIMLKKLGLEASAFDILRTDAETIARIVIPKNLKKVG
jgi:hypothetical protein